MNSFVSMNAIIETYYTSGTYFTQGEEASTCLRINVGWVKKGAATITTRRAFAPSLRIPAIGDTPSVLVSLIHSFHAVVMTVCTAGQLSFLFQQLGDHHLGRERQSLPRLWLLGGRGREWREDAQTNKTEGNGKIQSSRAESESRRLA